MKQIVKGKVRSFSPTFIGLMGFGFMFVGQVISVKVLKVDVGSLIANIGALLLVVGLLQWLFDEDSREALVSHVADRLVQRLDEHNRCASIGIQDCLMDAKEICSPKYAEALEQAKVLAIGFQYSDSLIGRYQRIIQHRIDAKRKTQILHVRPSGAASNYLAQWTSHPIDVGRKVTDLLAYIERTFHKNQFLTIKEHDVVIRYTFIYTESAVWLTLMSNSHEHQPLVPAIRIEKPSPLYDFIESDLVALGVEL